MRSLGLRSDRSRLMTKGLVLEGGWRAPVFYFAFDHSTEPLVYCSCRLLLNQLIHPSPAHKSCTSPSSHPNKYNKSTMLVEFNLFGANLCTFSFALKATPSPAAESISRSLAPSPTDTTDGTGTEGVMRLSGAGLEADEVAVVVAMLAAARERRNVRFAAAVTIG